jgi:A/G-specific adenine glycosylase
MSFFEKGIIQFYKTSKRDLPWRKPKVSAYEVWISEIMLQQTQVKRVIEYYNNFLVKFPSIFILSQSSWEEFLPYYQGLGYYRRGENMLKLAKILCSEYNGVFPQDKKLLMKLPGIGEYTSSAILSFAYNQDYLAFDTNIQKVFGRFFYGNKKHHISKQDKNNITAPKQDFNAAVMDFSSALCTTKPQCHICFLSKKCIYSKNKGKDEPLQKRVLSRFPTSKAQVHLWLHKNHKEYYSSHPDTFQVFQLSPLYNTRLKIQEYFRETYKLEVSVRPPRQKLYIKDIPTLYINAQILEGKHYFGIFKPEDIEDIL